MLAMAVRVVALQVLTQLPDASLRFLVVVRVCIESLSSFLTQLSFSRGFLCVFRCPSVNVISEPKE